MRMRELELGKGTIAYSGETAEYFAAQVRRRWWVRLMFSALLVVAGMTLLLGPMLGNADPVYSATVVSSSATPGEARLSYGSPAKEIAVVVPVEEAWAVGSTIQISVAPDGTVTVGNYRQTTLILGSALVLLGIGIEVIGRRRGAVKQGLQS